MIRRVTRVTGLPLAALLLAGCAVAEESASNWTMETDPEVTWEVVHVLSQTSTLAVLDESGNEVSPVIAFRCTEGAGEVSMQIDWQRFISSFNTEAGFQIDDGSRNWIKLGVDGTNKITLSRSASDVTELLEGMSGGTTLSVETEPYSEPSIFAEFDLAGFADSAASLKEACGA